MAHDSSNQANAPDRKVALLFPGQGAHCPEMLDGLRSHPSFPSRYEVVCHVLGRDPLSEHSASGNGYLNRNSVSSLLTVLASSISLDMFQEASSGTPALLAGYSVGQWTALYAAGALRYEQLIEVTHRRARFMDECFEETSGAMLAVIGLPYAKVKEVCDNVAGTGDFLVVSNNNCLGQYSLAGTEAAISAAIPLLEAHSPKKLQRLPVSGAWHCELLAPAARAFREYLKDVRLAPRHTPVLDNVSGGLLPEDDNRVKDQLAEHIACPVEWERCIKTMIDLGCCEFIEIGFGNILTKFGFFIDRKVKHRYFYTPTSQG